VFDWFSLHLLAIIVVALQFGGMMYFAFMFTPMVFKFQEAKEASLFLRQVFPVFYRFNSAISIFPALMLFPGRTSHVEVATLLSVAAVFLFKARVLLPIAEAARVENNTAKFKTIHRVSVLIYVMQLLALFTLLIKLINNID